MEPFDGFVAVRGPRSAGSAGAVAPTDNRWRAAPAVAIGRSAVESEGRGRRRPTSRRPEMTRVWRSKTGRARTGWPSCGRECPSRIDRSGTCRARRPPRCPGRGRCARLRLGPVAGPSGRWPCQLRSSTPLRPRLMTSRRPSALTEHKRRPVDAEEEGIASAPTASASSIGPLSGGNPTRPSSRVCPSCRLDAEREAADLELRPAYSTTGSGSLPKPHSCPASPGTDGSAPRKRTATGGSQLLSFDVRLDRRTGPRTNSEIEPQAQTCAPTAWSAVYRSPVSAVVAGQISICPADSS